MIDFGEWLPDQQAIASPLQVAKNVIPSAVGYSCLLYTSDAADD